MNNLISITVNNSDEVEVMREIYNENLDLLGTVELSYRSKEEQNKWWKENKSTIRAYLYQTKENPKECVGFCTLTDRGNFVTPMFAIKKEHWGKGYGTEIIQDYLLKANKPLAGSQLVSNKAIRYMNQKAGWIKVGTVVGPNGDIELLYHPGLNIENVNNYNIQSEIVSYLCKKYTYKNDRNLFKSIDSLSLKEVRTVSDERGNLAIIEGLHDLPFEIKRIYYIWNNINNHPRGGHAHKSLFQAIISLNGSCKIKLKNGLKEEEYVLRNPSECLIVPPGFWRDMYDFTQNCILLVLASDYFDDSDYIRDYQEFLEYVDGKE